MTNKNMTILMAVMLCLALGAFIALKQFNNPPEIAIDPVVGAANDTTNFEESGLRDSENLILAELASLKKEMTDMRVNLEKMKHQRELSSVGDGEGYSQSLEDQELQMMYSEIVLDPIKFQKVQDYQSQLLVDRERLTQDYFDSLDASDEAWSAASEGFIADSVALVESSIGGGAQVAESQCKSGVCKIAVTVPKSQGEGQTDTMAIEHKLLVSVSENFPKSRVKWVSDGGQLRLEGYLTDASAQLPENFGVLDDGALTADELRSVLGSR